MKVKAVKVNRAHYFLTDPHIRLLFNYIMTAVIAHTVFDPETMFCC